MTLLEKIISLCKRRGFVYPSSDIYGGLAATYDYGPLGVALKNNIRALWWKRFVTERADMFGVESAIMMHSKVWEASGHLQNFSDPLVECKKCHHRFRADHLLEASALEPGYDKEPVPASLPSVCPQCGGALTDTRDFNLLFKTFMGPVEENASVIYLRPETAAGMFVNFKNVVETMRARLPFGIAQSGKAFRNEITTESFIFRTREFEIMELEYFCRPEAASETFDMWLDRMMTFAAELGISKEKLHKKEKTGKDLAHYSDRTIDLEYEYPIGTKELWAIANRTDFDLKAHAKHSGVDLQYRDPETGEKFFPYVIEPTFGLDRTLFAVLAAAYTEVEPRSGSEETKAKHEQEIVLRLPKNIAPIQIAIFPLMTKEPLVVSAQDIATKLRQSFAVQYDASGAIGKRYRRHDEIGTPYCITVDYETANDQSVTVRDRDTMQQERIGMSEVVSYFQEKFL